MYQTASICFYIRLDLINKGMRETDTLINTVSQSENLLHKMSNFLFESTLNTSIIEQEAGHSLDRSPFYC